MVVSADVLDEFRISQKKKNGESMAVICRRLNDDSDGMVSEKKTVTIVYRDYVMSSLAVLVATCCWHKKGSEWREVSKRQ